MVRFMRFLVLGLFMVIGANAFAQVGSVDEAVSFESVVKSVMALIGNYKGLGGVGIAGAVVAILMQLLKTTLFAGFFKSNKSKLIKRLIVLSLGTVSGVIGLKLGGAGIVDALIGGILTSGAAMAIYESVKGLKSSK